MMNNTPQRKPEQDTNQLTEAQKLELRRQMYERIARGNSLAEAESTAQRQRQGR